MSLRFNIAICGCGPAGLAAALLLHRAGHNIQLFERFDAPRPVGSGLILQPTGLGVLAELGLYEEIAARGAVIERLFGAAAPSGRVVLDVRYRAMGEGWAGLAVHRSALFDVLYRAVLSAGIAVRTSVVVTGSAINADKRVLFGADGGPLGVFDLVVDAMGSHSPLKPAGADGKALEYGAFWASVPFPADAPFAPNALEQRYFRASRMAGVLPLGSPAAGMASQAAFFWSIRQQDVGRWRSEGLERWKDEVRGFWPECAAMLECISSPEDLTLARYVHFTLAQPFGERLVHVGDAAHSTSPQLGQGANMALLDVLALSEVLQRHRGLGDALRRYGAMRRWHVRLFQWASAAFTPFYQSDSRALPLFRDRIAAPLSRLPVADAFLARLVSGMTVKPLAGSTFRPHRT